MAGHFELDKSFPGSLWDMTAAQRAYLMGKPSDKGVTEKKMKKPVKRLNMEDMQKMSDEVEKKRAELKKKPQRKEVEHAR